MKYLISFRPFWKSDFLEHWILYSNYNILCNFILHFNVITKDYEFLFFGKLYQNLCFINYIKHKFFSFLVFFPNFLCFVHVLGLISLLSIVWCYLLLLTTFLTIPTSKICYDLHWWVVYFIHRWEVWGKETTVRILDHTIIEMVEDQNVITNENFDSFEANDDKCTQTLDVAKTPHPRPTSFD